MIDINDALDKITHVQKQPIKYQKKGYIMIKQITYKCQICSKTFDSENECKNHELNHTLADKLAIFPNAIKCPDCDGTGSVYGTDGCDIRTCYTCKGEGIVVPISQTITKYGSPFYKD